jgi:Tfp pilus assembly protein PilZ
MIYLEVRSSPKEGVGLRRRRHVKPRRRYERFSFLASAKVFTDSGRTSFQAYVTTLGRGGLGLFTEGFLEVGKEVRLELTWTDQEHRVCIDQLRGTVVSSQVGIDGNNLGVQFTELLGPNNYALLHYMQKAQEAEG